MNEPRWPVIGHEWAVEHLSRAIQHGRMRHAYLFTGPSQIGKTTLARAFAMTLNCTGDQPPCGECRACKLIAKDGHPDITYIEAEQEGGTLKIDQVRGLQQVVALRPYEARYRVAILKRFHEANPNAQDALLKTLEEPSPNTVLIVTANSADSLLATIVSRCQPLRLRPLPIDTVRQALEWQYDAPQDIAKTLAQISGGRIGWAIRALEDTAALDRRIAALDTLNEALQGNRRDRFKLAEQLAKDKGELFYLLEVWIGYWRDALLCATGSKVPVTNYDRRATIEELAHHAAPDQIEAALLATRRTLDYLAKNVNTRLALETLMLDYP
ncbi:MAG: DNA polymerase III subunit delta' [Anaerolineae bacterium]|nr:DNA polymerase III subunit delta' [Anaerolineae bacterium]